MGIGPSGKVTLPPTMESRFPCPFSHVVEGVLSVCQTGLGFPLGCTAHPVPHRLTPAGPLLLPGWGGGQARPGEQGEAARLPPNWATTMLWSGSGCGRRSFS